jgi:hypothetical protein
METGTSSRAAVGLALIAVVVVGCGSSSHKPRAASAAPAPSTFGWLRPGQPPAGWPVAAISDGASIAFPRGWARIHSDPGTASAALYGPHGTFLGYLNVTPRQGDESLTNWSTFRVKHNGEEGDLGVVALASTSSRPVGDQRVSCVKDAYTTRLRTHYVELACLISGPRTSVVAVGASPPNAWPQISPLLERSIASVRA